jgi:hypothetical protein
MESAQTPSTELASVDIPGGILAVEVVRSRTEPVLAIHGISSQRKLWNWLRAAEPGLSLITVRPVPGVDHAAAIMSPPGAQASAELINEALTTGAHS